jgi:hypothetical protein
MDTYQIVINQSGDGQKEKDDSFMGGVPKLPPETIIPKCNLCQSQESFFFQIAFPTTHEWSSMSIALFHCTSCPTKEYCIPKMLRSPLKNAPIPHNFLNDYQVNFHVLTFLTRDGVLQSGYTEKVRFKRWDLVKVEDTAPIASKVGGTPNWLLEDESPGLYADSIPLVFLFQLEAGMVFETLPEAPPQASPYTWPGEQPDPFYELFNANELYAFGTQDRNNPLVYLLTQRD